LIVVSELHTYVPNPSYVEEEDEFVDEEFQHEEEVGKSTFIKKMKSKLEILFNILCFGILRQFMISMSMMKILWR
jgi:hypothetical protein